MTEKHDQRLCHYELYCRCYCTACLAWRHDPAWPLVPKSEALPMGERDYSKVLAWWQEQATKQGARAERLEAFAQEFISWADDGEGDDDGLIAKAKTLLDAA